MQIERERERVTQKEERQAKVYTLIYLPCTSTLLLSFHITLQGRLLLPFLSWVSCRCCCCCWCRQQCNAARADIRDLSRSTYRRGDYYCFGRSCCRELCMHCVLLLLLLVLLASAVMKDVSRCELAVCPGFSNICRCRSCCSWWSIGYVLVVTLICVRMTIGRKFWQDNKYLVVNFSSYTCLFVL